MARTFTRQEFYDLVWSKPMTHLAKEFILSDVALHKICKKHDIPNPPLGWWAKKAAGKPVKQTPLPRLKDPSLDHIKIVGGEMRPEPDFIANARENARIMASSIDAISEPPENPIVEQTMTFLRKNEPGEAGLVSVVQPGLVKVHAAPASIGRLRLALNRIASVAEAVGAKLVRTESAAAFECEGEIVNFSVIETTKRVDHVVTEQELAEQAAWKAEQQAKYSEDDWHYLLSFRLPRPRWDIHPTGQLSFEFEGRYLREGPARRAYRDAKIQRLENMAADIVVAIRVFAGAIRQDRLIREEDARKEAEARRQRELALRAKHIEERRGSALDSLLEDIGTLDRLRRLVAALRAEQGASSMGRVGAFVSFAEARLAAWERALSADALEQRFAEKRLFGDDDDFDFQARRY